MNSTAGREGLCTTAGSGKPARHADRRLKTLNERQSPGPYAEQCQGAYPGDRTTVNERTGDEFDCQRHALNGQWQHHRRR